MVFLQNILDDTYMSSPFFHFSFPIFKCYWYFFEYIQLNLPFTVSDTWLNSILFFLTILIGWFSSRDMSRIELDCKNYKRFVNNKCDRSCKKLLNKARIRTAQGLRLKNAEIKKT